MECFGIWLPVTLLGKLLGSDTTCEFRVTVFGEGDLSLRLDACNELELAGGEAACIRVFLFAML